ASTLLTLLSVLLFHSISTLLLFSIIFSFSTLPPPPTSTLFPYTTLFRSALAYRGRRGGRHRTRQVFLVILTERLPLPPRVDSSRDRKSTRLNSSHVAISYAVFCLKKKKKYSFGCNCDHGYDRYRPHENQR